MKTDIQDFFLSTESVKKIDSSYNGEFSNIIVKDKYEIYPKISYPMISIEEITNEDEQRYFEGEERVSYLGYQFEINCEQDLTRTAIQNVRYIMELLDGYLKQEKYVCLRRMGDPAIAPSKNDTNVMSGYLRYECNLDIKTNTIYRRY